MEEKKLREFIKYWQESADRDFITMQNLVKSKDYHWALFLGHLVVEKYLKALYVQNKEKHAIFGHDLLRLARKIDLELSKEQEDWLDTITSFNVSARYDNYKQHFYKLCTKEYADTWINRIMELRKWLISQL